MIPDWMKWDIERKRDPGFEHERPALEIPPAESEGRDREEPEPKRVVVIDLWGEE